MSPSDVYLQLLEEKRRASAEQMRSCYGDKQRLDAGHLRQVSPARARKLRRRGDCPWWSNDLGWYVWRPDWSNRK